MYEDMGHYANWFFKCSWHLFYLILLPIHLLLYQQESDLITMHIALQYRNEILAIVSNLKQQPYGHFDMESIPDDYFVNSRGSSEIVYLQGCSSSSIFKSIFFNTC